MLSDGVPVSRIALLAPATTRLAASVCLLSLFFWVLRMLCDSSTMTTPNRSSRNSCARISSILNDTMVTRGGSFPAKFKDSLSSLPKTTWTCLGSTTPGSHLSSSFAHASLRDAGTTTNSGHSCL